MNFNDWEKILEIEKSDYEKTEKIVRIKSILIGKRYEEVSSMPHRKMISLLKNVDLNLNGELVFKFKWKGEEFNLIDDIDDMNFYQYCDAQAYIEEGKMLDFFICFTFNKETYKITSNMMNEFERRRGIFEDLPHSIWYSYIDWIIKKKMNSIKSYKASLMNPKVVMDMEEAFIKNILESLNSFQSLVIDPLRKKSFIKYYTATLLSRLFIYLLKRMKPRLTIRLLERILKKIRIKNELGEIIYPI